MEPTGMNPARALPIALQSPLTVILLVLLIIVVSRLKSTPARFLVIAIWLRFVLDAHAFYTLRKIGGLTLNAMGSILIVAIGLFCVSLRYLRWTILLPIYALIAVIVLSSVVNHMPAAMVEQGTKFGYLILIVISTYQALKAEDAKDFSRALLVAFLPPLVYVAEALVLGVHIFAASDSSVSYTGGFYHEAVFSVSVAGGLVAAAFATRVNGAVRLIFIAASIGALFAANYRTTIIALLPLLLYLLASIPMLTLRKEGRVLLVAGGLLAACIALPLANLDLGPRVQSVVDFASKPGDFIRPVDTFTRDERSEASGRAYVWSQYAGGFRESGPLQRLIGHGPDSWEDVFPVYAQNTVLSYLYEFGLLGAIAVVLVWLAMGVPILSAPRSTQPRLLLLHLGFLILNMSTMPFWLIEGLIMYGLMCGYTIYYGQIGAEQRRSGPPSWALRRRAVS